MRNVTWHKKTKSVSFAERFNVNAKILPATFRNSALNYLYMSPPSPLWWSDPEFIKLLITCNFYNNKYLYCIQFTIH